jgi:hypothetical protein
MTPGPATSSFAVLFAPYEEWNLLALPRRQFLIEAFTADLDRIAAGTFRFRHNSVWLMLPAGRGASRI